MYEKKRALVLKKFLVPKSRLHLFIYLELSSDESNSH
jgi:hypothetical protein